MFCISGEVDHELNHLAHTTEHVSTTWLLCRIRSTQTQT